MLPIPSTVPENHPSRRMNPEVLPELYKNTTRWEGVISDERIKASTKPSPPKHIPHSMYHADVLRRRNLFVDKFSFDDIPAEGNVLLMAKEAYSLNDFEVNVRFEFIKYVNGTDDVVYRGDRRRWANNDMIEMNSKHHHWNYMPITMVWCMMGKTKPVYNQYIVWLVEQRMFDYDLHTQIMTYAIQYGSLDLVLALMGVFFCVNALGVRKNFDKNVSVFLETACMWHNHAVFCVLESMHWHTLRINYLHYLELACISSSDTGDEILEHLCSKIAVLGNINFLKQLIENKQWRKIALVQKALNKHNLFIDSEQLNTLLSALPEEVSTRAREALRN